MNDTDKTKEQLLKELEGLRQHLAEHGTSEMERKLEESLFRSLFTNSPIGIYVVQDGKFQFVNSRFQRDTGYSEPELVGSDSLGIVVSDEREIVREHAVSMLKGDRTAPYDFRIVDKSGDTRYVIGTVAPIQYGGKRAALGYYMDITDGKRVQQALRETADRYKNVIANLGDAISTNIGMMERSWRQRDVIARLPKATVIERRDITEDLMVIKIEPEVSFTFKAGQYCTLGLGSVERAYSIASGPHESFLELFVELVPLPDGALTPLMWKLNVGDCMSIRPRAKGIFTMDERYNHHFMVATVTGVAPFVSTIRNYLHRGGQGHKFYVLQGASYQGEFTYMEELKELCSNHPDTVVYVPTVSRPREEQNATWPGISGRVNNIVEEYVDMFGLDPKSTLIYACGHPGMIEDVNEKLTARGFRVKEERYWKQ